VRHRSGAERQRRNDPRRLTHPKHEETTVGYELNDEELALRDMVAKLCAKYGEDYWQRLDIAREYPADFVQELTDAGLLAVMIGEEYGGGGGTLRDAAISLETINRSGGTGIPAHAQMYTMKTILRHGNEEQKQRYLPEIAAGRLR